jgi:hypothetical protein
MTTFSPRAVNIVTTGPEDEEGRRKVDAIR